MRTITIEEHFLSSEAREVMEKNPSSLNALFTGSRELQRRLVDLDALRLKDLDAGGVDLQVISHVSIGSLSLSSDAEVKLTQAANNQLAVAIAAHPTRFAGLAILPTTVPEVAADELERAVRSLGMKGAIINGTAQGRFLDDPIFLPILERAVAMDVPIYLHPAEPLAAVQEAYYSGFTPTVNLFLRTSGWGWHCETAVHVLRMILAGVFDRLPLLKIIVGHMGEMVPFMLQRFDTIFTRVAQNLEHTVSEYFLRNFFVTFGGFFSEPLLLLALQTIGIDRLLYAVDYPFAENERGRMFLDRIALSPADKEKISHLNAERVLKLAAT